jgi:hypothetical protein
MMRTLGVCVLVAILGSSRVAAAKPDPDPCMPDGYDVVSFAPRTDGVDVRLVPQFGLGVVWLRFQVGRRVAAADETRTDCVLDIPSISVDVEVRHGAFVVEIRAGDGAGAREVVRRARWLIAGSPPRGRVARARGKH